MYRMITVLVMARLVVGPAVASEKTDVMAVVQKWADGSGSCADLTSILDDIPPYEWHGAGACAKWSGDFDAYAKLNEYTDQITTLGKPRLVEITSDRAYVVVPASVTYKLKGKPRKESGATAALALQKVTSGWRITGWAWGTGIDVAIQTASGS